MKTRLCKVLLMCTILFCFNSSYSQNDIWNQNGTDVYTSSTNDAGIGTTSPDMKLTVNGKVHTEELIIDLNVPGPDYVFKKDYPLLSVLELEKYIKQNNHLPEIPSANELAEKGLSISQMSMLMLKKTEELTLYIIDHKKRIDALEKVINNK